LKQVATSAEHLSSSKPTAVSLGQQTLGCRTEAFLHHSQWIQRTNTGRRLKLDLETNQKWQNAWQKESRKGKDKVPLLVSTQLHKSHCEMPLMRSKAQNQNDFANCRAVLLGPHQVETATAKLYAGVRKIIKTQLPRGLFCPEKSSPSTSVR